MQTWDKMKQIWEKLGYLGKMRKREKKNGNGKNLDGGDGVENNAWCGGRVWVVGWWLVRLVFEKKPKRRKEMGREGSQHRWGMRWGRGESDLKMGHVRPLNECARSHK